MKDTMRNLTLSAAALAALTVVAPKASADGPFRHFPLPPSPHEVREMWRERHESPRQEFREHAREFRGREFRGGEWREHGYGGWGRVYIAPTRPFARFRYAAPHRVFSGFRFYSACPGPGFVYVAGYGWALPPFFGAVWVPGHYDFEGYWVDGFWR